MASQTETNETAAAKSIDVCPALRSTADVVLISSDAVRFPVHKHILAAASGFFNTMFSLPQPHAVTTPSDLPVVEMSESLSVLKTLLSYIYPVARSPVDTLQQLKGVAEASMKYDIDAVTSSLEAELTSARFLDEHPLEVYCVACMLGFERAAIIASKATLRIDAQTLWSDQSVVAMGDVLGKDVARLMQLRMTRAKQAKSFLDLISLRYDEAPECLCRKAYPWVQLWITRAAAELDERPVSGKIFSAAFMFNAMADSPKTCSCGQTLNKIWDAFALARLQKKIDDLPATIAQPVRRRPKV